MLLPTLVIGLYLFVFASNQYVAEAQFAVRGNVEPMENISLGQYTNLIQKHNSQDSFIVRDYIGSQTMVEALEKSIGISKMFSRTEADFWARFDPDDPIEDLTKYWRKHVEAHIDSISGVIRLSVRAFTPEDALTIAHEVVTRSEALINDISKRAQADMVVQAESDAKVAQERLRKAHLAPADLPQPVGRDRSDQDGRGDADHPDAPAQGQAQGRERPAGPAQLEPRRALALDPDDGRQHRGHRPADEDAPGRADQRRLRPGGPNLTEALLQYEGLLVERTIAEKLEESAHMLLDRARVSASKQHIFLATFVPPVLPTDSLYPERGHTPAGGVLLLPGDLEFVRAAASRASATRGCRPAPRREDLDPARRGL